MVAFEAILPIRCFICSLFHKSAIYHYLDMASSPLIRREVSQFSALPASTHAYIEYLQSSLSQTRNHCKRRFGARVAVPSCAEVEHVDFLPMERELASTSTAPCRPQASCCFCPVRKSPVAATDSIGDHHWALHLPPHQVAEWIAATRPVESHLRK